MHGSAPTWGRSASALGKSDAKVDQDTLVVKIGGVTLFSRGTPRKFDLAKVEKHLAGKQIRVDCDLHLGRAAFCAITCDLSREYITINADYHT